MISLTLLYLTFYTDKIVITLFLLKEFNFITKFGSKFLNKI